jgi:hypothetical protein
MNIEGIWFYNMNSFIVLEIIDPEVNALFSAIWKITMGTTNPKRAHITLRGPYKGRVPISAINTCKKRLQYDAIRLNGIGKFINGDENVVYIQVSSPNIRETWWKPDYPISEFGFEPHISLYRGENKKLADCIYKYLTKEKIDIICAEHRIIVNKVHEYDLFKTEYRIEGKYDILIENKKISRTFINRLKKIVEDNK